jgi:hypothetical protein
MGKTWRRHRTIPTGRGRLPQPAVPCRSEAVSQKPSKRVRALAVAVRWSAYDERRGIGDPFSPPSPRLGSFGFFPFGYPEAASLELAPAQVSGSYLTVAVARMWFVFWGNVMLGGVK